ncbi:uncharacterized protein LOC100897181 [Galendromus occidentalis]|uniref:Uncharacterized protein LOC100897181 n=1 Tax=Galendromus occidentalis TaxID=34638 RepID=A0AAJ6VVJ4_9ACAR|nr:uncharacterized protein LOC100897181 [Galendromus occidentalis]
MPKPKLELSELVREFGDDVFSCNETTLICKACSKTFPNARRFNLTQHAATSSHQKSVVLLRRRQEEESRLEAAACSPDLPSFPMDLCGAFLAADIPLHKLENPTLRNFLEASTSRIIPNESTLRKFYVHEIYQRKMQTIRESIGQSSIWISIGETVDFMGRSIAHVVIGALNKEAAGRPYLLNCEIVERTNAHTVARVFYKSVEDLWPNDVQHERVLVFVTDAAPYMVAAANSLKVLFPNMIHVTCLAHAIHRVAEQARTIFPNVDRLISSVKKILLKAPSRVEAFRAVLIGVPLPPKPILTRWGSWINAALYHAEHFEAIRSFVNDLDSTDAAAIGEAQDLYRLDSLRQDLILISANLHFVPRTITLLETSGASLQESLQHVRDFEAMINFTRRQKLYPVKQKLEFVLSRNTGLESLRQIQGVLEGSLRLEESPIASALSVEQVPKFKFAPIVSCDVERSFSVFKSLFRENRNGLTAAHLKEYIVIACNQDQ